MKKEKQKNLLQRYPLSCVLIVVIWVLCLTPWIPESPLNHGWRLFLFAFLAPIAMGGLVELAQAYCTGGRRSGEWLDFLANSLGVCLGELIGLFLCWRVKR